MPIFATYLKNTFNYSDFEIQQIRYALTSILSDISKIVIMGFFFFYIHRILSYLVAISILLVLRTRTGGLHFQHYISCLAISFLILFLAIEILPRISFGIHHYIFFSFLSVLINLSCAPIVSNYRPAPSRVQKRKAKKQALFIISIYTLISILFSNSLYIITGFWIIQLQSLQLFVARILTKEVTNT